MVQLCLYVRLSRISRSLVCMWARELGACACVRVCLHSEVVAPVLQEPLVWTYDPRTTVETSVIVKKMVS